MNYDIALKGSTNEVRTRQTGSRKYREEDLMYGDNVFGE